MRDALARIQNLHGESWKTMPDPHYLSSQMNTRGVTVNDRLIAVDYICRLVDDYDLFLTTFSMAVNYFDRCLSLSRDGAFSDYTFKCIASACLFIASKFMDTKFPRVRDLLVDGATEVVFFKLEQQIISGLKWRLRAVLPSDFMPLICDMFDIAYDIDRLQTFADMALYEYDFLTLTPLRVAIVCVFFLLYDRGLLPDSNGLSTLLEEACMPVGDLFDWCIRLFDVIGKHSSTYAVQSRHVLERLETHRKAEVDNSKKRMRLQ